MKTKAIENAIADLDGADLARVVAAALARMGEKGREGADALVERLQELDEGTDAEQDQRGNIKEALSWLSEEVSDEAFG